MRIDWWTLALQTANVLILIWLLAKFLFRPVAEIVARRQDQANKLLADAAEACRQVTDERSSLERAHADMGAVRDKVMAGAHTEAEIERAALLARTNEEMTKLRSEARAAILRDRLAMEKTLIDHARSLSVDIARRVLTRVGPAVEVDVFLAGLCEQIRALSPHERAAFAPLDQADSVEVVTAAPLDSDAAEHVRRAVTEAFGSKLALMFRSEPAVIAGIELYSRHTVIRNSWRNDLERIQGELNRADE
jgi:F-type H+-transporting ATPase subunit b